MTNYAHLWFYFVFLCVCFVILEVAYTMILSGLLLLFLLSDWTESVEGDTVDINTLARIIDFFEQK